jgi:nitroreductase
MSDATNESPHLLYDQLFDVITRRMSIRHIRPDPIPEDYINKILEAGRWAMSGANAQPWEFMVVRDPEVKQALADCYAGPLHEFIYWMEQMRLPELRHPGFWKKDGTERRPDDEREPVSWAKAPALIIILGDGRRQWGTVNGALTFGRHQSHLTDGLSNAAMLMHLAAASLGLASQHVTIQLEEPFKRVLDIPDLIMIHHIIPIGFAAIDRRPTVRRPLEDMTHYDKYDHDKYMTSEDVVKFLYELRGKTMSAYHTKPKES